MKESIIVDMKRMMIVKAVIFDMDGVLLDSMKFHVRAWQDVFKRYGLDIPALEVYNREGESWRKSASDFLIMAGLNPAPDLVEQVFAKREQIFKKIFKPEVFADAIPLLNLLKQKKLKLGLVTATLKKNVVNMLPENIINFFDALVCGGETKNGKPHPEPYLKALEKLRVSAKEAIVIENAVYGIQSAKNAGIRCIGLTTSVPKEYLSKADYIMGSLCEISDWFRRFL